MTMPGRKYTSESYRYGFNGKEMDNEVSGNGNQYDYGFRIYNPRIGRFLSVDPLTLSYPWYTPYQFAGNKPISSVDLDGMEEYNYLGKLYDEMADAAISYLSDKAVEMTVNLVADFTKAAINHYSENYKVKAEGTISVTISLGAQGGYEIKHIAGGTSNGTSVELISFTGKIDYTTGELDGTISYIDKNNEKILEKGFSSTLPLEQLGIPLSVSGSVNSTEIKDATTEAVNKHKGTIEASVGALVGVAAFKSVEKDYGEGTKTNEIGVKVGTAGFTIGAGVEIDVSIGLLEVSVSSEKGL